METSQLYQFLVIMLEYVSPKEKETALFSLLDHIYNEDISDIGVLRDYADSEEDDWMCKKINAYIKENGLEDEEEDEDW